MSWGQTGRILMVWPKHGRILTRRLDLVLLQRHSATLGAQLALVTKDPDVCFNANQLRIPVFTSLRQAQGIRWIVTRRRRPSIHRLEPRPDFTFLHEQAHPQNRSWTERIYIRIGSFTLSAIAVLAVAAILIPGAWIILTPLKKTQEMVLPVSANPSIQVANLAGELPARTISVIVEGRDSISTTDTIQVPENPATGSVQFKNLTEKAVDIPIGTIVSTTGQKPIRYATTRAGRVPSGLGEIAIIPISAVIPGSSSNTSAQSIQAIEGSLGLSLTVSNLQPVIYGTDRRVPGPSLTDRTRLYDQLVLRLRQTAAKELNANLAGDDILLTATITLTRVVEKTFIPIEDTPADRLQLSLSLEFQALLVPGADLRSMVTTVLDANLPDGYTAIPQSLTLEMESQPILDSKSTARWRLHTRRTIQAQVSQSQAINLSRGLSPAQAGKHLADDLPLGGPPLIVMAPSWWPRLPLVPFRITIISN